MAIVTRPEEKRLFERVEDVEGVRYELVLTTHAIYVERHVNIISQWVGGMLLAIFLHIIGTIVQYVLLRASHESMRIPWRDLRATGIRQLPRHIILLLGIAVTIVLPILLAVVGNGFYLATKNYFFSQLFSLIAVAAFFIGCIATVVMMIRFPRTALVLGLDWRNLEFHSLGNEESVREIADRVVLIQEKVLANAQRDAAASSRSGASQTSTPAPSQVPQPSPLPGPQSRR